MYVCECVCVSVCLINFNSFQFIKNLLNSENSFIFLYQIYGGKKRMECKFCHFLSLSAYIKSMLSSEMFVMWLNV